MSSPILFRRGVFLFASWLMIVVPAFAAPGGFSATLSAEEREAAGLTALSADERVALDQLVADDVAFARRENLAELAGSFLSRRGETNRQEAGLHRLSSEQVAKLNELVAAAIASRPVPRERPRLKQSDVLAAKRRGEVHGSVTLTYGWGAGGREYRAGSLWVDYTDPSNRFRLGVGLSTSEGDGYPGYYPGYYDYPGAYWPGYYDYGFYSPPIFFFPTSAYRADVHGGFFAADETRFRGLPAGGFGGRGGRRR